MTDRTPLTNTALKFSNADALWLMQAAPHVYRALVSLRAGQRMTIGKIEADVRRLIPIHSGEDEDRDDETLSRLITMFVLEAVEANMTDLKEPGWVIPRRPLV